MLFVCHCETELQVETGLAGYFYCDCLGCQFLKEKAMFENQLTMGLSYNDNLSILETNVTTVFTIDTQTLAQEWRMLDAQDLPVHQ